ncbi:hypothetical protein ACWD4T_23685 [Streptomyces umbrinus]
MRNTLARRNLAAVAMTGLGGTARDTDLVVSALQYLDPVVHNGFPAPKGIQILAQPCVRWRHLREAGRVQGVSSSFINLSSLEVGGGDLVGRIPEHLDLWFDLLSAAGLHAGSATIALCDEDCAYGPYRGRRVDLNCDGIELGEINWYHTVDGVQDGRGRPATVIDCGFAFERISWAADRRDSYHARLTPLHFSRVQGGEILNDRCRTLALLALSGIKPGSRGPRRYARKLADELSASFLAGVNVPGWLEHAAHYWQQFLAPEVVSRNDNTPESLAAASSADWVEQQATAKLARLLDQPTPPPGLEFKEAAELLTARSGGREALVKALNTLADPLPTSQAG